MKSPKLQKEKNNFRSNVLLQIDNLKTYFYSQEGTAKAVDGISFRIFQGKTVALVGESGSGKSVACFSIMRLVPKPGRIISGRIIFNGRDLLKLSETSMRRVRGNEIAMVFQEPMTSLNPVYTIGDQIAEAIVLHQKKTRRQAMRLSAEMLELVGIPEPKKRLKSYPYELSGGMRQRVAIAMSLSCNPKLLIADEPTSAIDVTIQAQILDLLRKIQSETGMSILFITHDLGVAAEIANSVVVMYAGYTVEEGNVRSIFKHPKHPYTKALLNSLPRVDKDIGSPARLEVIPGNIPYPLSMPEGCVFHPRCRYATATCSQMMPEIENCGESNLVRCFRWKNLTPIKNEELPVIFAGKQEYKSERRGTIKQKLFEINRLTKYFPVRSGFLPLRSTKIKAVENMSFEIELGETVGLAGESGSGKTTVGRLLLRLLEPTYGEIKFNGMNLVELSTDSLREYRKEMQIIFQDPFASLNPRMNIGKAIGEGYKIHKLGKKKEREERIGELLKMVGLDPIHAFRYPHEFSGGQRQRVVIARAIALRPKFLVADEPVAALDVSLRAQIINLLQDLKERLNLTMLLISHDLSLLEFICNRVIVMYLGHIVEIASTKELFKNPIHPYTLALFSAIPVPDPFYEKKRIILQGEIPSPINPPSGCVFKTRCPDFIKDCSYVDPELKVAGPDHFVACIRN